MEVKEGVGGNVVISVSLVLRRDRGRCSPEFRIKGSFESKPPAPELLRLRPGAGRVGTEDGVSAPAPVTDDDSSMANGRYRGPEYGVGEQTVSEQGSG